MKSCFYYIKLFVFILGLSIGCYGQTRQSSNLVKEVAISYIDWDVETFEGQLFLDFFFDIHKQRRLEKNIIRNSADINILQNYLLDIKEDDTVNINICTDYRLVCLVKWANNVVDTIGYGECFVMCYNGIFKRPNLELLHFLMKKMRPEFRVPLVNYIAEMKKYLRCK
ncbi:MAG: hypothetical protein LC105_12125 [Chitinophagales bacterium]|nr:hypothetical protein [Chitinophagales bacterium]